MFPHTSEAWIFIAVACVIGFIIGQWIKARKKKVKTNDDYVHGLKERILAETRAQAKKGKKKNRKASKKNGGS
jgi:hypothetical protein